MSRPVPSATVSPPRAGRSRRPTARLARGWLAALMLGISAVAAAAEVVTSPAALPATSDRPSVFLAGSIDMGHAGNWQATLIDALANQPVVVFNPRRADWQADWKPQLADPHFKQQVEWELAALERADVVVMYLAPDSQSPISLLELGLYARSGKLLLLCPPGYWRKGNVDAVAARYGIEQVDSMPALIARLKQRLAQPTRRPSG